ncbi:MAG TPA: AMP-binding protein [Candidatus Binatia bacterium]|nr:AMP-binding protein [Candidatus Binatia bacterium]
MIEQASRPRDGNRQPLCEPSAGQVAASALTAFTTFCERRTERRFAQYADFERWAIGHGVDFWTLFVEWSGLRCEGSASPAIAGTGVEHARFFPELKLNYAAHLLRTDAAGCEAHRPALTAVHADRAAERWTRGELRARVAALSAGLSALGFAAGERAVLLAPNTAHAAAGALAAAAIGCTLSSATADLGVFALLSRFGQVDPGLLLAELPAGDTPAARTQRERFVELVRSLHTLRAVVLLDEHPVPDGIEIPVHRASELIARHSGSEPVWPMLPFNHPLYILFTSGTTGVPKCLVHGAGGTLLEHLKEHLLHCDLKPADKLFFQTSTGWMMWNW